MPLFDFTTRSPQDELQFAWHRVPHDQFSQFASLEGRAVCLLKICTHSASLILKPIYYIGKGSFYVLLFSAIKINFLILEGRMKIDYIAIGFQLIRTGVVAPCGQALQLFKAIMGLLHPGCYFRPDDLQPYFETLAEIAKEVGCEESFVEILRKGASIRNLKKLQDGQIYYQELIQHDLAQMAEKLKDPTMPKEDKEAILLMLAPLPSDPKGSGIYACTGGFARVLETIRASLDVPGEPERILPWLVERFKEELLQQMVMEAETQKKYISYFEGDDKAHDQFVDAAHFGNILIMNIGPKIGLSDEMIEHSKPDLFNQVGSWPESQLQELFERYVELFNEEALLSFLLGRINSQIDGQRGLKKLRDHMTKVLAEKVTDEELQASKKEVQARFGVGEALSDDPFLYTKLHYYKNPDANPSDEDATDFNENGIKTFAATLQTNPLLLPEI